MKGICDNCGGEIPERRQRYLFAGRKKKHAFCSDKCGREFESAVYNGIVVKG
jgi:hypothetical protein